MQLEFSVIKQNITRTDKNAVVEGSKNYLTAHFAFSEEWIGTKTAIFKNGNETYMVILDGDACLVPWEVITAGMLYVSVFSGNLITADTAAVAILHSGYEEGKTPKPPTEDVYRQILDKIEDITGEACEIVSVPVRAYTLKKSTFTVFECPLETLAIMLEPTGGYGEYNFSFIVGSDDFTLTLPAGYAWDGNDAPTFELGKLYEASICNMDKLVLISKGANYEPAS